MGTSNSYGGPKDTSVLLPDWAKPGDNDRNGSAPLPPLQKPWQAAKGNMTRFAGGGGQQALRNAGRSYIAAKGGAKSAARAAHAGRATTQRLAAFLSSAARDGIETALASLGLQNLIGRSIDLVFAGLVDALATGVTDFDQAAARVAMQHAFDEFYEQCTKLGNFDVLNSLTEEQVSKAIEQYVVGYIYERWLQELGNRIEDKQISEHEAIRLEDEVKDYVRDAVRLEIGDRNILQIDWAGDEGRRIIDSLYEEAYSFIEEGGG